MLREQHWPRHPITQRQLAVALGVSVPLISSWENVSRPAVPPAERLTAYAAFFATPRSVESVPYRLLPEAEFGEEELARRAELQRELLGLRATAIGRAARPDLAVPAAEGSTDLPVASGPWHFPGENQITIVCAGLPQQDLRNIAMATPGNPDYTELYRFSDLDALFELHGHIRAANPASDVVVRLATDLSPDDYSSHLVLIGGVDWNAATSNMADHLEVPVTQVGRDHDPAGACFQAMVDGEAQRYRPKVNIDDGREVLKEDIAHFFRGVNPFNRKRTVSVCNGMYSRGVLGAVRTLTDKRFRDRNAAYLEKRFAGSSQYSVLCRVTIVDNKVLTPDWTAPDTVLHEWPEAMA
jgi:transcriptional regulator with XRE-family HTH domain